MTTEGTPVIEGLFSETADGPRLVGSRCTTCTTPYFPKSSLCHNPECTESKIEDASFGPLGTLWSSSIQNYPPPPPARYDEPYEPYALGVVDLADGLRVVGRMAVEDPASVQVGDRVELVLGPIYHEEDGTEAISWMFRPI
ncbi:MAG: OB-fold domain-containing protein [Acidimicrobiia bacterium]|nr:OB-fold domain-containing protein [Acidimicrobiia bacterium]